MAAVHRQIAQLIYYSNGGFGWKNLWDEVPVQHRRFYVKEIQNIKKKEADAAKGNTTQQQNFNVPKRGNNEQTKRQVQQQAKQAKQKAKQSVKNQQSKTKTSSTPDTSASDLEKLMDQLKKQSQ
jgi:hypothetical protein